MRKFTGMGYVGDLIEASVLYGWALNEIQSYISLGKGDSDVLSPEEIAVLLPNP